MLPEHSPRYVHVASQTQRTLVKLKTLATYGAHPREKEIEKGSEHDIIYSEVSQAQLQRLEG